MNYSDLQAFLSVVETGGVTRAAESLNRVPSSVTARINNLEDYLGVKLFHREKKRLAVTAEGRLLYGYAQRIRDLVQEAEARVRSSEPGGTFCIGAMESTAAARLPAPLSRLHAQYPDIELELRTGSSRALYEQLIGNRLDAVFIADPPEDDRLEMRDTFLEELLLVAPAGQQPILTAADVRKKTLVAFKDGCAYRNRALRWFESFGDRPGRIIELASYHAILGGVAAGMGVAIVPAEVLRTFSERDMLSTHRMEDKHGLAMTKLAWRKGWSTANISALQRCLEAEPPSPAA